MRSRNNDNSNTEKILGYEVSESLLELLGREDALVKQLNMAKHALVVASKSSSRLSEYKKNVSVLEKKLSDVRRDIQMYFINYLGITVSGIIKEDEPTSGQAYVKREQMIASLYE